MEGNKSPNDLNPESPSVIHGYKSCQARDAKWLCLSTIYEKLHRPNFYSLGGTYIADVPDCWFTYKVEHVGDIFLLHLFVCKIGDDSFTISISNASEITLDKTKNAYLSKCVTAIYIQKEKSDEINHKSLDYLTTYHFSNLDVEFLKDRDLYIPIEFPASSSASQDVNVLNDVKLNHDCGDLLKNNFGSDFHIESADGVKFNVHRLILGEHSDVFKAMFKEETAESQKSYVKLINVNADVLRCLLEFIYTGTVKDLENIDLVNLLIIADSYNIKGLCELLQYALSKHITVDNALDILVLADMYNSDYLKRETFKFIKMNKNSFKSTTMKELSNVKLMKELLLYIAC